MDTLQQMFHFHWLLLLPPIFVLYRSFRGKPTLPTLILATAMGIVLALSFQSYSLDNIMVSLKSGFTVDMATWVQDPPDTVRTLLDRGGLYSLSEAVVIAFTVFVFIGALDCIDAIPTVVRHLFGFTDSSRATVLATLAATALTNSLTSNQYATSFIVGDAFKSKFDALGIPRKVLSRSLEDTGTMLESLVFWTPSAVYMVKTLGVPFQDYWYWQLLSLFNFVVAIVLALTGWGCFYEEPESYSAPDGKLGPFERDRKGRTEESESG